MHARLTLLLLGVSTLAIPAAQATELCVKCTGPDAAYSCVVGSGHSNATLDTVAKFYCITTLAKAGSHASCTIDRSVTAPCPGERRELPIPAILNDNDSEGDQPKNTSPAPLDGQGQASHVQQEHGAQEANVPPPPAEHPASGPPPGQPPPDQAASEPPPKTVQEMVEKSAQSAGNGLNETQKTAGAAAKSASTALEKAGSAVGGAAKSSWQCLSSFFSKC